MFKKDQKVWCAMFGEGVVTKIHHESEGAYRVVVSFKGRRVGTYTTDGKYSVDRNATLFPYPVKIVQDESATKPSINWEHVNSRYKYLAQDEIGTCWVYEHVPILIEDEWVSSRGDCTPADCLQSLVPGTCFWKDSLVERP